MQLILTEDQVLLSRTAHEFVNASGGVSRLRKLRDSGDERAYAREVYARMAELGWTAIPFAESDGGLGMGLSELVLVTEAMGRALVPEPLIPSVVLAGRAIALAGSAAQKERWLPSILSGEKVLALAHTKPRARFELTHVPFRAERTTDGYRLHGQATQVWAGHLADAYVLSARTSGPDASREGITLFMVGGSVPGLRSERQLRVDSLNTASLTLEGVEVREADVLGGLDAGYGPLERVIDEATVALCGEMLGGMSEAFERTRVYLKERRQFGVPIGSFQALKHRAARMYIELELGRSALMAAARALDANSPEASLLVSVAKAKLSDAYGLITNEAVQMHGGIGMTDEHDIGFFMKRARACEMTFGDAAYHRERFASLSGY